MCVCLMIYHEKITYHLAVITCWAILVILPKGFLCKYRHVPPCAVMPVLLRKKAWGFHHRVSITERPHTNPGGPACCTPRLRGMACCSWATNLDSMLLYNVRLNKHTRK